MERQEIHEMSSGSLLIEEVEFETNDTNTEDEVIPDTEGSGTTANFQELAHKTQYEYHSFLLEKGVKQCKKCS